MRYFGLMILVFMSYQTAQGASVVKQQVSFSGKSAGPPANFTWHIDGKKFRVDVERNGVVNNYVFNGRIFYSCGKLSTQEMKFLEDLKIQDKGLMQSLKNGGCQQVSTDFLIRFYLSPYEAIDSPTVSDGITANINVEGASTSLAGSTSKAAKIKCVELKRKYSIKPLKSGTGYKIDESSCHAPSIKWRKALSRELSMMLMRQPTARKYSQTLIKDLKRRSGMTLTSKLTKSSTAKGVLSISVKTLSVENKKISKKLLAFPTGYKTFDAGNLAMLSKIKVTGKNKKTLKNSNGGAEDMANVLSFFLTGGRL